MPQPSMTQPLLFHELSTARRVLLAGAGGGFDVYAGLPLAVALWNRGVDVVFANLSFTSLPATNAEKVHAGLRLVTAGTTGEDRYFPERSLARWLKSRGRPDQVYAFEKVGVRPLRAAYQALLERSPVDAVILVDGGTDILMRGDEAGLGTPAEDMASLGAVDGLDVATKLLVCIGFGVDAHHGVCHAHVLENIAALEKQGGYLGAFSVPAVSLEGSAYLDAVDAAHRDTPTVSIVNGSIAAAMRGDFGDHHFTQRTRGSELFINPLMALYFCFRLHAVAQQRIRMDAINATTTSWEVAAHAESIQLGSAGRPRRSIPH